MNINYQVPNQIIWDQNEKTGFRVVDIIDSDTGTKLIAITSHSTKESDWESKIVPMGYSYDIAAVEALGYELMSKVPEIMRYLETNTEITYEDILSFIGLE